MHSPPNSAPLSSSQLARLRERYGDMGQCCSTTRDEETKLAPPPEVQLSDARRRRTTHSSGSGPLVAALAPSREATPAAASSSAPAAAAPAAADAAATYAADVLAGRLTGDVDALAAVHLPEGAALRDAAAVGRVCRDCALLNNSDFPILALRRLETLDARLAAAGVVPSLVDEACVAGVRLVRRELQPQLDSILDGASWKLNMRQTMTMASGVKTTRRCVVETFTKATTGGRLETKITATIPLRLTSCLSAVLIPDLYATWLPAVKESAELARISRFRRLVYLRADHIWPFAQRDICLVGYGDILNATSVVIYLRSCHADEHLDERAATEARSDADHCVRAKVFGAFVLEVISATETRLTNVLYFDPILKVLPQGIIDFIMSKFASQVAPMFASQGSKFEEGGELRHLLDTPEHAPVFAEVMRRLACGGMHESVREGSLSG